jgi:hypothetical protein
MFPFDEILRQTAFVGQNLPFLVANGTDPGTALTIWEVTLFDQVCDRGSGSNDDLPFRDI